MSLNPELAHVTYVVGCIYLDMESIRVEKLERFLRSAVEFQAALPQLCANLIGIEVRNSEVVVINGRGFASHLAQCQRKNLQDPGYVLWPTAV